MKFDHEYFDAGLYRMGTRCEKWDEARKEHGDVLPLWVADMDFPSPPAVAEAVLKRGASFKADKVSTKANKNIWLYSAQYNGWICVYDYKNDESKV